ncbi:MAG: hypothetical protein ABR599_01135 [Gemmatimonadota bacterium]
MPLPDTLREALVWLAVSVFAATQAALLTLAVRAPRPAAGRLSRAADVALLAVSASLTAILLAICARVVLEAL